MLDLVVVGIGIILAGFLVLVLALLSRASSEEGERRAEVKGGGVIMIGPIPIVFGSDARWTSIAMALGIVLVVLLILLEVVRL